MSVMHHRVRPPSRRGVLRSCFRILGVGLVKKEVEGGRRGPSERARVPELDDCIGAVHGTADGASTLLRVEVVGGGERWLPVEYSGGG
jgi:hypothetical protein